MFSNNPKMAYFDLEKLQFPLLIRKWKEGDWFQPLGMKGKMKLSDYFINQKLSLFEKQNIRILCANNMQESILWIIGQRTDERAKVEKNTKNILILKLK